jgi:hypothetical protein
VSHKEYDQDQQQTTNRKPKKKEKHEFWHSVACSDELPGTIRGGGCSKMPHGLNAGQENGHRCFGASRPMRIVASWFGFD